MLIKGGVKAGVADLPFSQPHIGFEGTSGWRDVLRIDCSWLLADEWFVRGSQVHVIV